MNVQQISDLQTPIGELLKAAEATGVVIRADDQEQYALLPLDDDLLDFLLERNPKFIEECEQIRQRMTSGEYYSQDDVERLLEESDAETHQPPRGSLHGTLADLGPAPSAEDIDEAQREMWGNFPRDDF